MDSISVKLEVELVDEQQRKVYFWKRCEERQSQEAQKINYICPYFPYPRLSAQFEKCMEAFAGDISIVAYNPRHL